MSGVAGRGDDRSAPGRRHRPLTPAWILFAVVAVALVVGLASLGIWQVQRLAWKEALIAAASERVGLEPVPAPGPAVWPDIVANPQAHIYRRVSIRGRWLSGQDTWVQATTDLGSGYWLLTPLAVDDGGVVLINRGYVQRREPGLASTAEPGAVTVTGLLRVSEANGIFPRRNDPEADRWFSRELAAIADRRGLGRIAPYFIDAQTTVATAGGAETPVNPADGVVAPVPGLTVVSFRNHHLGYALTWFVLAAMTAGAALRVFYWRWRGQQAGAGAGGE